MPYPIKKASPRRTQKVVSTMPIEGSNELLLSKFMKPSQALIIRNFFIRMQTELYERGGIKQLQKVDSIEQPKVLKLWTDTLFLLGYATTLAVFNLNDDTINIIKSDFSANLTDAERYGLDMYSCNGKYGDVIYKTTLPTITYGTQTVNYVVGSTITQAVTGATATIVADSDSGANGTLTLDNINGVFDATNIITGSGGGSATATSLVTYTNTAAITASAGTVPKCEALSVFDLSLVAVNTNNDESEALLSKQNDFTDWNTASLNLGDAYSIQYKFAGYATTSSNFQGNQSGSQSYGNVLVTGYKDGYAGFERTTETISGTIVQVFRTVFEKLNDGMEKNSLSFPNGIFFVNENGFFILLAGSNGKRIELTSKIKRSRKNDFDFTDCDIAWSALDNRVYLTLRENSGVNNLILWFDTQNLKDIIWGEIPYAVSRFFSKDDKIYGVASTSPRVLEMFSEDQLDDEGLNIDTEYQQPMNSGDIDNIKDFYAIHVGGDISPTAPYTIEVLGVSEEGGKPVSTGIKYTWTSAGTMATESELGTAEQGVSGIAATAASLEPVYTTASGYIKAYGYSSYIVKLTSSDKLKATIRYITAKILDTREQRKALLISTT